MGPAALAQVLRPLSALFDPAAYPDLLRGLEAPDDAAVWRLDATRALVLTADFFPPLVDEPYAFGAIAAANSLSDLYAMGAEPLLGINLVGFPQDLDPEILSEILRGGAEKVREAGAVIAGGHTTHDEEPKYGLAVLGLVHPDRLWAKTGIRAGDALFLTKPIGTGVVTTALKRERAEAEHLAAAVASMSRLGRGAARILREQGGAVHAATDITGFGLLGHAHEMAHPSGLGLHLRWDALPILPGAEGYARAGLVPGGGERNRAHFGAFCRTRRGLEPWQEILLHDPQTSGGLFFAIDSGRAADLERAFREAAEPLWRVGEARAGEPGTLHIE